MFKFLKNKIKNAVDKFSKKVEEEGEEVQEEAVEEKQEIVEEPKEQKKEVKEKKPKKEKKKKEKKEKVVEKEETKEEKTEEVQEEISEPEEPKKIEKVKEEPVEIKKVKEKRFVFGAKKINEKKFEDLFWDLEVMLLENNVATEVIEKIKSDLKEKIVDKPIKKVAEVIQNSLRESIKEVLEVDKVKIEDHLDKKPLVICFLGINGSGKTTTIAKIANMLLEKKKTLVLAAADTFRAAAIDQLQEHADKLEVKLIKHDYGSDPAAVAFDAIKHAKAKNIDVVLIDTAGRLHSNTNLVDEMKKIIRVANPDLKIFVGESITGNDCVEQAVKFNEAVELDGIILSKADIDEKGGAAISVSYVTGKPIMYIGTGQEYKDIEEFNSDKVLETLGL